MSRRPGGGSLRHPSLNKSPPSPGPKLSHSIDRREKEISQDHFLSHSKAREEKTSSTLCVYFVCFYNFWAPHKVVTNYDQEALASPMRMGNDESENCVQASLVLSSAEHFFWHCESRELMSFPSISISFPEHCTFCHTFQLLKKKISLWLKLTFSRVSLETLQPSTRTP